MAEAIERNGIYGANIPTFNPDMWRLVDLANFKWILIRADTTVQMAEMARDKGLKVIVQMPDHFNNGDWIHPAGYAEYCHGALRPFEPYSGLAVLDNEPNRIDAKANPWYAEEFCRWYRAVAAEFRYQDSASPWELIFPGMAETPLLGVDYWRQVNRENILESRGIGVHPYWYTAEQLDQPYWGGSWLQVRDMYPGKELYILEYGQIGSGAPGLDTAANELHFIQGLQDPVQCACKFILGGTKEWSHWFLTEAEARALAGV